MNIKLYIYIYIYHLQKDCFIVSQLFSVAIHAGCFKLGSKPAQLYNRLSILLLSHQVTYVSLGTITLSFTFCLTEYQSTQYVHERVYLCTYKINK